MQCSGNSPPLGWHHLFGYGMGVYFHRETPVAQWILGVLLFFQKLRTPPGGLPRKERLPLSSDLRPGGTLGVTHPDRHLSMRMATLLDLKGLERGRPGGFSGTGEGLYGSRKIPNSSSKRLRGKTWASPAGCQSQRKISSIRRLIPFSNLFKEGPDPCQTQLEQDVTFCR